MSDRNAKGKIVFLSTFIMLIFIILSIQSVQQLLASNRMREKDEQVEAQHDIALALFRTDDEFFAYELNNSDFYKTGNSKFITRHDSLLIQLQGLFQVFNDNEAAENKIENKLVKYDSVFKDIVTKIKIRGYRDYGLEGVMRATAHQIEKKRLLPEVDYLRLRRNEKDYLLRSDSTYINKFDSLIARDANANGGARTLLHDYSRAFHEMAAMSTIIGIETQTHLTDSLDRVGNNLLDAIEARDASVDEVIYKIHHNGIILFMIGMIGSTIICFTLIVIIMKRP